MIIDSSAVIAILKGEPDAARLIDILGRAARTMISAATYLESAIVIDANDDPVLSRRFDDLIMLAGVGVEPVTRAHADIARQAYRDFGKRSGHPARLNYGDCFSYALTRAAGESLLYTGDDFTHTDIERAG